MISKIRHSSTLVAQLPPHLQRAARDAYAISLRAVFVFAAVATLAAYLVRLPVRLSFPFPSKCIPPCPGTVTDVLAIFFNARVI